MSTLQRALVYAGKGLKVFPLAPRSKIPLISHGHGHLDASDDPEVVTSLFANTPDANIGISAAMSGLVIVDVDVGQKNGRLAIGDQTMAALLEEHDWYPDTLTVRTPSGGTHYYLKARPGASYKGTLGPDIDVKWNGYVLAPGSIIDDVEYTIINKGNIEEAPRWMEREERKPRPNGESEWDKVQVEAALSTINPSCDRTEWLRIVMALHEGSHGSQEGYELFDRFSRGELYGLESPPENYDSLKNSRDWDSFKSDREITLGTLFYRAKELGWKPPEIIISVPEHGFRATPAPDFMKTVFLPRPFLLEPVLPAKGLSLIYAKAGIGKTQITLAMALALANGKDLWRFTASKPTPVLYIDGEMPSKLLQDYLNTQADATGLSFDGLSLLCDDMFEDGLPNLRYEEGRKALDDLIRQYPVVILDNEVSLFRGGDENNAEYWGDIGDWFRSLRRRGQSVLLVHHAGKGGDQRGTSAREDLMDTVIKVRMANEEESDHLNVELLFTKHRGSFGKIVRPMTLELVSDERGVAQWKWGEGESASQYESFVTMHEEERPREEIMALAGISKRTYYRYRQKYETTVDKHQMATPGNYYE